jgi:alkaline phosphatase
MIQKLIILTSIFYFVYAAVDWSEDMNADKWNKQASDNINRILKQKLNRNIAKNLIMLIGDGMGITTVTAGRILKGQKQKRNGEEEITHMESLDHAAYSKTYNIDAQTADSAGTATAYLSGVKTRIGVVGLDGKTIYGDCKSSKFSKIESIAKWAHDAGKSVGIVTTTRITHASPSAVYAHSASRDWETYDGKNFNKGHFDDGCRDIASQLIESGSYINVKYFYKKIIVS